MFSSLYGVSVLLNLVVFFREAELQPKFTAVPSSPFNVLEGNNISLEWSYDLDGVEIKRVELTDVTSSPTKRILEVTPKDNPPVDVFGDYIGRVQVNVTNTNTSITILGANRTIDSKDYEFEVVPRGTSLAPSVVTILVQYPPEFTNVSATQTVVEGGSSITLHCIAIGEPLPSITWTRVFDNGSDSDVLFTGSEQFVLDNVRSSTGTYRCTADNGIGTALNRTIAVDVIYKPENVMLMVNDSNICKGDIISITCSAVGKPAVDTYQLFENDTPVTDSDTAGVWKRTMSAQENITYRCVAKNTAGTSDKNVTVTVNVPAVVYTLENITVTEGENRTLTCNVSGSPTLSVTWTEVKTGIRSMGITRQLTHINRNEFGEYKCEASNFCGNDTKSTYLIVQYPPENFQFEASEIEVCQDEVINFTCSADGNPAVDTYQLFENDTLVTDGINSHGMWNRTMSAGGVFIYKCVANNTAGSGESETVTVTVNVPSAIQPIQNVSITKGGSVTLSCNVSGIPSPMVSWIKVVGGERFDVSELEFTNINRTQAGEYRCEASNQCGNASQTATIEVRHPPDNVQLVTSAAGNKACRGDVIAITCSAVAVPSVASYELFEDDIATLETSDSGMWTRNYTREGMFIYKCVANNSLGTGQSENVTITVNVASSIQPIEKQTIMEGRNLTVVCNASGIPAPMVTWIKVGGDMAIDGSELVFTNISRTEAGEYRCNASNECGNASEVATIEVLFKPDNVQLVTSAADDKACRGDVISINCSAKAVPSEISYQLFENDTAILDASGRWSRPLTTAGMFTYTCVPNNTLGTGENATVTVTVNVPSAVDPIHNENITEGGNVTLSCSASGTPHPMVSWIKVDGGERFDVSDLVFTNISRSEAGEYRCEASNTCGNASETATIKVQYPPENVQLKTSAVDSKTCKEETISINCSADAVPSVTSYQLFENDLVIVGTSGMWSRTLSSGGVFVYKCVANNSLGSRESESVTVTVNVRSSIYPIQNETITEAGSVTLSCNATGMPSPMVSWIKVDGGERFNSSELVFTNINRNEAGEYRCEASNECGNASEAARIFVQYTPEIISISVNQTANKDESVSLNCTADGYPTPTITWTKVSDNSSVSFPLMITGKQNEGLYRCTADNGIGSPATEEVFITVHLPSSIEPLTNKTNVQKGGNVTLYCNVSGTPTPHVSWTHVSTGEKWSSKRKVIVGVKVDDLGEYRCEASNRYGNATESIFIFFPGGLCEEKCPSVKSCRKFGQYLCLCEKGKKGTDCKENDELKTTFEVGIEFRDEFKSEYEDLENPETKLYVSKVTNAVKKEFDGSGVKDVKVTKLRKGSVIADMELTFDQERGASEVDALLSEAASDGNIGGIEVGEIKSDGVIKEPEEPEECGTFFEGEDCKKAKPGLIALCVVGAVAVLGILVAIIACFVHKNKSNGTSLSNGNYAQRVEPEGNMANGGRETGRGNDGYEHDRANGHSYPSETPMVTFKNTNPAETPGIAINDSSVTQKAQPGEGTYADLGDFHQKAPAPVTVTEEPLKMPPAYEKTEYAEISQFLRAPETADEEAKDESSQDDRSNLNQEESSPPESNSDNNDVRSQEILLEI